MCTDSELVTFWDATGGKLTTLVECSHFCQTSCGARQGCSLVISSSTGDVAVQRLPFLVTRGLLDCGASVLSDEEMWSQPEMGMQIL